METVSTILFSNQFDPFHLMNFMFQENVETSRWRGPVYSVHVVHFTVCNYISVFSGLVMQFVLFYFITYADLVLRSSN